MRTYASGSDFLEACRHERFDCALLDWQMPDQSGLEVLEHLRSSANSLPVAMCAGTDDGELRSTCAALGVKTLLLKPAEGAVLLATIRSMLPGRDREIPAWPWIDTPR